MLFSKMAFRSAVRNTGCSWRVVASENRKTKLNDDQVEQIYAMLKEADIKVIDIAKQYGVCRATIFNAVESVKPERTQVAVKAR